MRSLLARTVAAIVLAREMLVAAPSHGAEPKPGTTLFNGKDLSGWDTYLGPAYDPVAKEFAGAPLGLNSDPNHVFSVVSIDGGAAIRISGTAFGGLSTVKDYDDYELQPSTSCRTGCSPAAGRLAPRPALGASGSTST